MRTLTALFVGLGSIGTRHLKNLANLCADRGWTLQADALRSDPARPLRDGVAALLHRQFADIPTEIGSFLKRLPTKYFHHCIHRIGLILLYLEFEFHHQPLFLFKSLQVTRKLEQNNI